MEKTRRWLSSAQPARAASVAPMAAGSAPAPMLPIVWTGIALAG